MIHAQSICPTKTKCGCNPTKKVKPMRHSGWISIARNDGKFDQWLDNKRNSIPEYADMPLTLGYYTREDIPFYYALADAFTVCDQNFCSSRTGTNPNRLHFWTGTVRPEQNENSRAHVGNDDMDYGTLNWPAFPERLEKLGISWKCYHNAGAIDT